MIKDPEKHARALRIFLHSLIQVGSEMTAVMGYKGKRHRCFSNAYALGPGVLDAQWHDMNDADMEGMLKDKECRYVTPCTGVNLNEMNHASSNASLNAS